MLLQRAAAEDFDEEEQEALEAENEAEEELYDQVGSKGTGAALLQSLLLPLSWGAASATRGIAARCIGSRLRL